SRAPHHGARSRAGGWPQRRPDPGRASGGARTRRPPRNRGGNRHQGLVRTTPAGVKRLACRTLLRTERPIMLPQGKAAISGATRLIGIVGDPINQVKSPQTWNPRLAESGHDAVLVPIHVRVADFDGTIDAIMRIANLDGLVFTMPFKE